MRKLAVSVVTLTSLTACTQGDELGSNWSFELPENTITDDEQFARFGEQVGSDDLDGVAAAEPALPELSPNFTDGATSAPADAGAAPAPRPAEMGAVPSTPPEWEGPSDLSIDELVEFTFPQRGPRPNPLAQVRFSPTGPQASNRYIERIMGAADASRQSRPVSVSVASGLSSPAAVQEPAYLRSLPQPVQPDLNSAIGGPVAVAPPARQRLDQLLTRATPTELRATLEAPADIGPAMLPPLPAADRAVVSAS
ncbi:MAG: hypothetical protein AAFU71_15510 [Cyanobacteria bacterium J06632_22]